MAYRRTAHMQRRLADNRERIVRAARQLVAEGGFREAQIGAVARVAGLSTGAIYKYFPSKTDLFIRVLRDAVRHEVAILDHIAAAPRTSAQRLHAAVESFARRALEGPYLAYAFIAEPADARVDAARLRARRAFGEVFKRIVRDGIRRGEFPEQHLDVTAACIVGAFTEALVGPVAPSARAVGNKEKLVRAICRFCERAVAGAVLSKA
ncbi:MAG TPA: TetR/AcrR family transcriptional regulator [Candidatus Binatia bacterium]|nr:TetR/AcrR family transcriptional regulator [Candidatus Binatia bacterium]